MRRQPIPYGYVAYTGRALSASVVDGYNQIQSDINAWLDARRNPPAWLLDWSFRYFRDAADCGSR